MLLSFVSKPCESESEAMAHVKGMMADFGRSHGKVKIVSLDATEESGVWQAVLVLEMEAPELEEDAKPKKGHPEEPEHDISPATLYYMHKYGFRGTFHGPSPEELFPDFHMAPPDVEPVHSHGGAPELVGSDLVLKNDHLVPDFNMVETAYGQVPLSDMGLAPAVQERLAHDARLTEEYQALRRKVYMEELESLRPQYRDDPRPEPGRAA